MPAVGKDAPPPPPPPLLMGRYQTVKQLGKGTFGKVYQARNVETGEEVAIKVMNKDHLAKCGVEQQQIKREIDIMHRVRHPNVVRLHDVMGSKKRIFVVMELVRGGSLLEYVAPGRGVGEPAARRVFQQLVSALEYCHSLGVYHRDIKPENVLVDHDGGRIKVADFGLSALAADTKRNEAILLHTVCGTPMYIAPEVLARRGYDGAGADVWACGVLLFLLVAGRLPFGDRSGSAEAVLSLYRMICRGEYQCPPSFHPNLVRLVRRLLCPDPARRITIPQIKQTAWFRRGFKEINFYIGEYAQRDLFSDSDDDDDSTVTSATSSSEDPSSPVAAGAHHHCGNNNGSRMHTSVSAPTLSSFDQNAAVQVKPRMRRPKSLNAFDIIASSPSLDLSGLFDEPGEQVRFVSAAPVPNIISKLEEIAGHVSFTARTKEHHVSIEATRNGQRGALLISARIFELTPELVMVKVTKKAGDTAEYRQFCNNELKPRLRGLIDDGMPAEDVVCAGDS